MPSFIMVESSGRSGEIINTVMCDPNVVLDAILKAYEKKPQSIGNGVTNAPHSRIAPAATCCSSRSCRDLGICEPQKHISMTSVWRAPARQIFPAQLVQVINQLALVEVTLVFCDDLLGRAVAAGLERVRPFAARQAPAPEIVRAADIDGAFRKHAAQAA